MREGEREKKERERELWPTMGVGVPVESHQWKEKKRKTEMNILHLSARVDSSCLDFTVGWKKKKLHIYF